MSSMANPQLPQRTPMLPPVAPPGPAGLGIAGVYPAAFMPGADGNVADHPAIQAAIAQLAGLGAQPNPFGGAPGPMMQDRSFTPSVPVHQLQHGIVDPGMGDFRMAPPHRIPHPSFIPQAPGLMAHQLDEPLAQVRPHPVSPMHELTSHDLEALSQALRTHAQRLFSLGG